jgi:hypothetical protein
MSHSSPEQTRSRTSKIFNSVLRVVFESVITIPVLAILTVLSQHVLVMFEVIVSPFWGYIDKYPFRFLFVALIVSVASTLSIKIVRKLWRQSVDLRLMKRLISNFGIESFWEQAPRADQEKAWEYCRDSIAAHPSDLRIMGASGWRTFGAPNSPLHETVNNYPGAIHVLLMDPENPHLLERANSLDARIDSYVTEIGQSINYLKTLKRNGNRDITLKLYKQPPIWKMIVTGSFLWLQHYKQGQHVHDMPVYGFASSTQDSLYHPLLEVFMKRWGRDGEQTRYIDLDSWDGFDDTGES